VVRQIDGFRARMRPHRGELPSYHQRAQQAWRLQKRRRVAGKGIGGRDRVTACVDVQLRDR